MLFNVIRIVSRLLLFLAASLCLPLQSGAAFDKQTPDTAIAPALTPEVEAPVAILVDITSGQVLYARNANRRFVPASITKVMTLFHAFELIDEGQLDPRANFTIADDTWRLWHGEGSTMWLQPDTPVSLDDLLTGIANVSANDGSIVLAEGASDSVKSWAEGMNQRARVLGMTSSHFATPNGWPDHGRTFTTAEDLVVLAQALIRRHPHKYARYVGKRTFTYNGVEQSNYDPLIGRVEGADGIKTGYTGEAGFGYLGTVERNGQRLVLVVAGANNLPARARSARNLVQWGFSAFDRIGLYSKAEFVGNVRVQDGEENLLALRSGRDVYVNIPKGRHSDLQMSIHYDGPLRAPVSAGEEVATLVINVPGMEPARIPLLAEHDIAKAGFFGRISNGISGWFW